MGFLLRVLVNILAIVLAASVVPGIRLDGVLPAVAAGLLLGLVNAVVRPVLLILTLPITLVTLGLFLFVLNGVCLWLVSLMVKGDRKSTRLNSSHITISYAVFCLKKK